MSEPDPCFLSVLRLPAERLARAFSGLAADRDDARILRSVLIKPEHESHVDWLHAATCDAAERVHPG